MYINKITTLYFCFFCPPNIMYTVVYPNIMHDIIYYSNTFHYLINNTARDIIFFSRSKHGLSHCVPCRAASLRSVAKRSIYTRDGKKLFEIGNLYTKFLFKIILCPSLICTIQHEPICTGNGTVRHRHDNVMHASTLLRQQSGSSRLTVEISGSPSDEELVLLALLLDQGWLTGGSRAIGGPLRLAATLTGPPP